MATTSLYFDIETSQYPIVYHESYNVSVGGLEKLHVFDAKKWHNIKEVGGSILAGKLALDRGWAINIGGGFHHCSADKGGGFCPYADITLMVRFLVDRNLINTAMIAVYIMDMYNRHIYPNDKRAKEAIRRRVELRSGVEDTEYLDKLTVNLQAALKEFKPDILVYNAGTDILWSDPLGLMKITKAGIIKRDQFVFETCRKHKIPIVMLTSGGYRRETAEIISESIGN
ncbi:putative histone deacetylase 11-like protein, partial [Operophtera brumata]